MGYQPTNSGDDKLKRPISKKEDLHVVFRESYKQPEKVMIGMEVEKHGIYTDDTTYKPVTYLGKNGMRKIQEKLLEEQGWDIEREEGKYITSMERSGSHFTLESGEAMGELSGRVHFNIHDLARELRLHDQEFSEVSKIFNITWLGIGFQPFSKNDDIKDVNIQRFSVGQAARNRDSSSKDAIWRRIASVQSNIDYTSEEDATKKFQTLLRLAPFVAAMFAHSPIKEHKATGYMSYRTHLLQKIASARSGLHKEFFEPDFNFESWIDLCLDIPMVAIVRNGEWIAIKDLTFKQYLKEGFEDHRPIMEDWVLHLSYMYTDARIKNYIELRVCDSLPPVLIPSMQALVKAFVYHEDGFHAMKQITKGWTFHDFEKANVAIAKEGMEAEVKGEKMLNLCKEVLDIASENLRSMNVKNAHDEDESVYLKPIKEFVFVREKCVASWVLDQWEGEWKRNPEKLIEWCTSYELK